MVAEIEALRTETTPFDVIAEGETPAHDAGKAASMVQPWCAAGATWWLETRWEMPHDAAERMQEVRRRISAGPPRPSAD